MCLLTLAYKVHPDYPLIVVANRDEFYARPTQDAHFWSAHPTILAGRDLEAGGTWFGVSRAGRWSTVTNFREGRVAPAPHSRGELPLGFLAGDESPADYSRRILTHGDDFNGFNLLTGTRDELVYACNRQAAIRSLPPGVYTLSNDFLDTPWPKAELARRELLRVLQAAPALETGDLLGVLASRQVFPDHQLPATGIGQEMERTLSPPFIVTPAYGTRCTTALLMGRGGEVVFVEQNFVRGEPAGQSLRYRFTIDGT